jgi:hypothetical protein
MAFDDIADDIASIIVRTDDAIYQAVRAQLRGEGVEAAKEMERRLSKVRRRLREAEAMLREEVGDED